MNRQSTIDLIVHCRKLAKAGKEHWYINENTLELYDHPPVPFWSDYEVSPNVYRVSDIAEISINDI